MGASAYTTFDQAVKALLLQGSVQCLTSHALPAPCRTGQHGQLRLPQQRPRPADVPR
jgi:hypothetical protein